MNRLMPTFPPHRERLVKRRTAPRPRIGTAATVATAATETVVPRVHAPRRRERLGLALGGGGLLVQLTYVLAHGLTQILGQRVLPSLQGPAGIPFFERTLLGLAVGVVGTGGLFVAAEHHPHRVARLVERLLIVALVLTAVVAGLYP
ncbi:MAG TPA: hypothetical protein VH877_09975 [Polyangia bacterium]|jgi:hypothetical protein|nr:hypothetical protein [Polyangia bacterium]